jgi:hypothetical protein
MNKYLNPAEIRTYTADGVERYIAYLGGKKFGKVTKLECTLCGAGEEIDQPYYYTCENDIVHPLCHHCVRGADGCDCDHGDNPPKADDRIIWYFEVPREVLFPKPGTTKDDAAELRAAGLPSSLPSVPLCPCGVVMYAPDSQAAGMCIMCRRTRERKQQQ